MTAGLRSPRVSAGAWSVAGNRTRIAFTVANFGRPVRGSVTCARGGIEVDRGGRPLGAWAEIDLNSLATGIARRDTDLRKPALLDIDRHPVLRWSSDRFAPAEDGRWSADGLLSARGVAVPLTVTGGPEAAPDAGWMRVRASAVLDRAPLGIRVPRFVIGRLIRIDIDSWLSPDAGR